MTNVNPRQKWRGTLAQAEATSGMEGVIGYLTDVQDLVYFKSDKAGDFIRIAARSLFNIPSDLEDWQKRDILDKILLPATTNELGALKVGKSMSVDIDGTINVSDIVPVGTIITQPVRDDAGMTSAGYLSMHDDTIPYSKTLYADLYAKIQGTAWIASENDDAFYLRNLSGLFVRGAGGQAAAPGAVQLGSVPVIFGNAEMVCSDTTINSNGAITRTQVHIRNMGSGGHVRCGNFGFNSSYQRNGNNFKGDHGRRNETAPDNISAFYYIKSTLGFVPQSQSDLQEMLTQMQKIYTDTVALKEELLGADYLVESVSDIQPGNQYYRLWKSGWLEQGITITANSFVWAYPKAYKDIPLATTGYRSARGGASHDGEINVRAISSTELTGGSRIAADAATLWVKVEGSAAK